jgi:hypothetical protein
MWPHRARHFPDVATSRPAFSRCGHIAPGIFPMWV